MEDFEGILYEWKFIDSLIDSSHMWGSPVLFFLESSFGWLEFLPCGQPNGDSPKNKNGQYGDFKKSGIPKRKKRLPPKGLIRPSRALEDP